LFYKIIEIWIIQRKEEKKKVNIVKYNVKEITESAYTKTASAYADSD
jgi:hypothetical protein